jgi:hypothetical protein
VAGQLASQPAWHGVIGKDALFSAKLGDRLERFGVDFLTCSARLLLADERLLGLGKDRDGVRPSWLP